MLDRPLEILLIEDNRADIDLTREGLREAKVITRLNVVEDGVKAMAYLRKEGIYISAVRPDLILLDLNLPKKDGREVLDEIKRDPYLRSIPVVILSCSESETDILKTYDLGANCYITKPLGLDQFIEVVNSLDEFWFKLVKLPPKELFKSVRSMLPSSPNSYPMKEDDHLIKILVIEDNQGDVDLLKEMLSEDKEHEFQISTSETLKKGVLEVMQHHFDIVLLDLSLPDSQGEETLIRFCAEAPNTPVVVLSGLNSKRAALNALQKGAQDYLVKGHIDGSLLARVIRYAMERKWIEQERSQLLAQEQQARSDAERAVWMRDEFFSIASHELKTPITSMKLQGDLLAKMLSEEKIENISLEKLRKMVNMSEQQTERLLKLVENLLDLSKINTGKLCLEPEPINFGVLVKEVVERLVDQFSQAGYQITTQLSSDVIGKWDRFRIEQVVVNLLTNAMKYGKGKPVEIIVDKTENRAILKVIDHGIGIKREAQSKIFDRFERAVKASAYSGLGLGLYIVRQIIDSHGGTIGVESAPGMGSTFTVELPFVTQESLLKTA